MSEYPAVRQVLLTLRLMRLIAQSRVRNRYDRPEELRLLPCIERLLEIVSKPDQLRFVQKRAVHQHACWSSRRTNADGYGEVRIARDGWPYKGNPRKGGASVWLTLCCSFANYTLSLAPVAQLDRASDYGSEG